jgi:hypothetical protein
VNKQEIVLLNCICKIKVYSFEQELISLFLTLPVVTSATGFFAVYLNSASSGEDLTGVGDEAAGALRSEVKGVKGL